MSLCPDGTIFSSSGVTLGGKQSSGLGRYNVSFDRDVSRCAYVATLGDNTGGTVTGEISATTIPDPNSLFIQTFNNDGIVNDKAFHLAVLC